jgi:hypothetical protein
MKFPISRETLQTFTREKEIEEMNKEQIEKQIVLDLDRFHRDFKAYMMGYNKEKKFVWGCIAGYNFGNGVINSNKLTKDKYLDIFIGKFLGLLCQSLSP